MTNPFKQTSSPDFGPYLFIMMTILYIAKTGIWQGGAGFMTSAKTPHEARMGNILSSWRWLMITLGTVVAVAAYVLNMESNYNDIQSQILTTTSSISDPYDQSANACSNCYVDHIQQVYWVCSQFS